MKLCTEKRSDAGGYWEPFRRDKDGNVVCWVSKDKRMLRSDELQGLPAPILDYFGRWWEWLGFKRKITDECNHVISKEHGAIKKNGKMVPVWHVVSMEFKKGVYSRELVREIDCGNSEWYLVKDDGLLLIVNEYGSCGCVGCEVEV